MSEENKDPEDKAEGAFDKAKGKAKEKAKEAKEKAKEFTEEAKEKAKEFTEEAKEKAKEFAEEAKESAKEFAEETKEAASDFTEDAKKTADEFSEGVKAVTEAENKKILAGILGIVLGAFGVHKFILGYQKEGFILLGITIVGFVLSCIGIGIFMVWISGMIGLIEGIIYLTKSDEDFYNTYQVGKKPWF
jgi:TM2 domain-containing membrane protein YozV